MTDDFQILLIEDSRADAWLIERALAEVSSPFRLTVALSGKEALDLLAKVGGPDAPDARFPDLILLDLNLPGMDGEEILSLLKKDPVLLAIPVVVLTTSRDDEDVLRSYRAGANTFIQKPAEYPRYRELVQVLQQYWKDTAIRPPVIRDP